METKGSMLKMMELPFHKSATLRSHREVRFIEKRTYKESFFIRVLFLGSGKSFSGGVEGEWTVDTCEDIR